LANKLGHRLFRQIPILSFANNLLMPPHLVMPDLIRLDPGIHPSSQ
jgi:hypothetical protein